jgi:hypothetical protein
MSFKFEFNLKENEGIIANDTNGVFMNPTFEQIADILKKEEHYLEVNQVEDIVMGENEKNIFVNIEVVSKTNKRYIKDIFIFKIPIIK